jgi:hypothetical protein
LAKVGLSDTKVLGLDLGHAKLTAMGGLALLLALRKSLVEGTTGRGERTSFEVKEGFRERKGIVPKGWVNHQLGT